MTNFDSDKVGVVPGTTAAHDRPPSPPSTPLVKAEAPPLPQSDKQAKPKKLTRIQRAHAIANRNVKVYGYFYGSIITTVSIPITVILFTVILFTVILFTVILFTVIFIAEWAYLALSVLFGGLVGLVIVWVCALVLIYDVMARLAVLAARLVAQSFHTHRGVYDRLLGIFFGLVYITVMLSLVGAVVVFARKVLFTICLYWFHAARWLYHHAPAKTAIMPLAQRGDASLS